MARWFARSYFTWVFIVTSLAVASAGPLEEGTTAFEHYDFTKAQQLLEPLAKEGNPHAQVILGHMSMNGWGALTIWANGDMNTASPYFPMVVDSLNMGGNATLHVNLDWSLAGFPEPVELKKKARVLLTQ